MARVLVGISGGIAAYKACDLVRLFVKGGHEVVPLVTPAAERFVRAETFFALARRSPSDDLYVHLTRADLLVVAPLTANTLAKLAHGLADNLVTEAALAHRGPVLLAPAMNPRMWASPATQSNVEVLRARGALFVGPGEGETAEGEWGVGRLAEPEEIFRRMGVALAEEARRRGAEVTLLAANLAVPPPRGVEVVETPTAAAMLDEALARRDSDVVVMAAAVADYRPAESAEGKRPKDDQPWQVTLEPTADVLRTLGEGRTNGQLLIGFAADRGDRGLARAREKLEQKRVDLMVYNDISRSDIGFDAGDNEVVLISAAGERRVAKAPKDEIAAAVVDAAEELLREQGR
ncbi:MAG: bifunctional phosphopantothenoylcysteine decarboxylase/phosphopantothenate--cysteine ligase CoaBC [Actinobacteria bacterium]|nr:MAG: bifunctional phosphopantothenoylcysteine decarboxylase/phosphopantothenate--cysteine ligase CoaBC [Actinomycetota bacterium]